MSHVRRQIREAIKTRLETLATNVFMSRVQALNSDELPALIIRAGSEDSGRSEADTIGTAQRERTFTVLIEAYVKGPSDMDDSLDALIVDVEKALTADNTLGGVAHDCFIESIDQPEISDEGDFSYAAVQMSWSVSYGVAETNPEVSL